MTLLPGSRCLSSVQYPGEGSVLSVLWVEGATMATGFHSVKVPAISTVEGGVAPPSPPVEDAGSAGRQLKVTRAPRLMLEREGKTDKH